VDELPVLAALGLLVEITFPRRLLAALARRAPATASLG